MGQTSIGCPRKQSNCEAASQGDSLDVWPSNALSEPPQVTMNTIIDGYNLIFECGLEGRSRTLMTLERARDRLIAALATNLSKTQRRGITVVFDAKTLPIKETSPVSTRNEMSIIFAVDHDDADSLIEELILKDSSPKQLTVVSSDHRIQKAASRRKATPIDSGVWYDLLEKTGTQADSPSCLTESSEGNADLEKLRAIDWAAEFGLNDHLKPNGDAAKADEKDATFNPFPPGYAEDLLDKLSDEDS